MQIGYIDRLPLVSSGHNERQLFVIEVHSTIQAVLLQGKVYLDVDTKSVIKLAGYITEVADNHDIRRVAKFFEGAITLKCPLTIDTDRYRYTLVSVYEGNQYIPLKERP